MFLSNTLKIEEVRTKDSPNSSTFVFRYLPPTMGLTIGNCLRRTLLTSLEGVAPVGIEISNKNGPVKSEFSTLAGVRETTPYLVLNCKEIVIEVNEEREKELFCLELKVENNDEKEERIITAADFQKIEGVEIKNPELQLATLATTSSNEKNPQLEIKLYCHKGRGYHQSEVQKQYFTEKENVIVLDTDYSPVKGDGVNFQINSVVVGPEKEEEELKLTVNTTGAISPKKALLESLEVISNFINAVQKEVK
jgi:DNA-directed RNA polymerase subunit alpha